MGIMDKLFGGTKQTSTLTPEQRALLGQLSGLQQQYNGNTYGILNEIAGNPTSAYEYDTDNGAAAFQSGIINPAMRQLNQQLRNVQHSSSLHSSANRFAQDQLKQGTMDNLNNLSYQNMLQQQQAKQSAQENAYGRQLSSLGQLMGGNQQVLGTQGVALQKKPGLLDGITAITGAAQGIKSLF